MMRLTRLLLPFLLVLVVPLLHHAQGTPIVSDWPDWRGPQRDGTSPERNLPGSWSPHGENLLWKAPYGARSAPIVLGDRLYLQNGAGEGESRQERVICFNADTGRVLWEYRFNVYQSDVPPHRVGWASPAADPKTGNIFVLGVGGALVSLNSDGKVLWQRSLGEEFGLITTHGGRTVSPVLEDDLVIVSGLSSGWGDQARGAHRFFAFNKNTGQTAWVDSPAGRPYDTTYSPPIAAVIGGVRLLIAGGGDGAMHALKPQTGESVWRFEMSKRGINTGAILVGGKVIVSHGEENLNTSEMGLIAAIDPTGTGKLGEAQVRWKTLGFLGGYSSPVSDGERIYQIDNGSNLFAFDAATGRQLWTQHLGTVQKASPVLGDGKLYVGTESGKFYILRPRTDGCEILDEDWLGPEQTPERVLGSAAISRGRVFFASDRALYAFGRKMNGRAAPVPYDPGTPAPDGKPAFVQVVPTELILAPGESVQLTARLFDAHGIFLRETPANWSLEGLSGTVENGKFTAAGEAHPQAGQVKATVGELSGKARIRVIPLLPWAIDFEASPAGAPPRHWINATGKYQVREVEGNKVLVKLSDNPFLRRAKTYLGPPEWSEYTIETDVRSDRHRRQMADAGVIAQRYALILFGNHQRLELQSWQPETQRTIRLKFPWQPDTWYRMKLRVENLPEGKVLARGKVWPTGEPEPAEWTIEKTDPIGNRAGSPGLYADAYVEVFFDNLKVYKNP